MTDALPPRATSTPRPLSFLVPALAGVLALTALGGEARAAEGRNAAMIGGAAAGVLGGLAAGALLGAQPQPHTRVIIPDPVVVRERPAYEERYEEERVVERRHRVVEEVVEDEVECRMERRRYFRADGAEIIKRVRVCD